MSSKIQFYETLVKCTNIFNLLNYIVYSEHKRMTIQCWVKQHRSKFWEISQNNIHLYIMLWKYSFKCFTRKKLMSKKQFLNPE